LQSLCKIAAADKYSREADDYVRLANTLYEIRRAIVKIETSEQLSKSNLQKLVDNIIDAALGYTNRWHYISALLAPVYVSKDGYIHTPYTIFRSVVTRTPTLNELYPIKVLLNNWKLCAQRIRKFSSRNCDELIERYLNDVETGNRFYVFGSAEYAHFHVFYSLQNYLNTAKLVRNFQKLMYDDGQLRMRLMATIIFTLLQMQNVDIGIKSYRPIVKQSTSCICARLKLNKIKGLNAVIVLLLLAMKFGPNSLYSVLPVISRYQKYYKFEPDGFWTVGFHVTDRVTVFRYPTPAAEHILPKLYEKLNPAFVKEGLCVEGE